MVTVIVFTRINEKCLSVSQYIAIGSQIYELLMFTIEYLSTMPFVEPYWLAHLAVIPVIPGSNAGWEQLS
jgi:hypothetical protein